METNMTPLSKVMDTCNNEGFTTNFVFEDDKLRDPDKGGHYDISDLKLVYEYRTEGQSNPGDMSILFCLACENGTKGQIVATYGPNGNNELIEFVNKIDKRDDFEVRMFH